MRVKSWAIERPVPYARYSRRIKRRRSREGCSFHQRGRSATADRSRRSVADDDRALLRPLAAQKLNLPEVPIHVAGGLTPAQVNASSLMDDRSHEEAKWA